MKRLAGEPDRKSARRRIAQELAERLAESENLAGLRSGNDSLEVGIFAALKFTVPPFGSALIATLFFF